MITRELALKIVDGRTPEDALKAHTAGLEALRRNSPPNMSAEQIYIARYGDVVGPQWLRHDLDVLYALRQLVDERAADV